MQLSQPYQRRALDAIGLWQLGDWQLKTYRIVYGGQAFDERLCEAARQLAKARLAASAPATAHYHLGFIGIHQGKTADFIFIDWWAEENELHHHVYVAPKGQPEAFEYKTPSGLIACAWDMHLMAFERDAWVETVLRGAPPSVEAYLQRWCSGPV